MKQAELTEKLVLALTPDMLDDIEDWRYEKRMPSRSEAIRRLIELGLEHPAERP